MMTLEQSNAFRRIVCGIEQSIKNKLKLRNTYGDRIIVEDEVLVYQGKKLLFKSKGHIVNSGLIPIVNFLSAALGGGNTAMPTYGWTAITFGRMRVGQGAGVTTNATVALTAEVATNPSAQSGATANPSAGVYRVSWVGTWNAGAIIAAVVTEIGLFLNAGGALQAFAGTQPAGTQYAMFSRLSEADGDFVHFTINIAVPLVIEWRLTFTFA